MSGTDNEPINHAEDFTVLEAQYQEALHRNHGAKARLAHLNSQVHTVCQPTPSGQNVSKRQRLNSHLEKLRSQRQYAAYETISAYIARAEEIAAREAVYEPPVLDTSIDSKSGQATGVGEEQTARLAKKVDEIRATFDDLVQELELALVRARQKLKREQALLEQVQAHHDGDVGEVSGTRRARALEVCRRELQEWIGASLLKCESGEPKRRALGMDTNVDTRSVDDSVREEAEREIDVRYEEYIEVRTRLLRAAEALRMPLPLPDRTDHSNTTLRRTQRGQAHGYDLAALNRTIATSNPRAHGRTVSFSDPQPSPSLAEIETQHLPLYRHEKLLASYTAHIKQQGKLHNAHLLQVLNLLSRESHLLTGYQSPLGLEGKAERGGQEGEIATLLKAWDYASRSADENLAKMVEVTVESAKGALHQADRRIEGVKLLEQMRREVLR